MPTRPNQVAPLIKQIIVKPAEEVVPQKRASQSLHSIEARQKAGFPEELIAAMFEVLGDMGGASVTMRVGNPPRIDIKHRLCTKPMSVKTKTCSIGPLQGTLPKYQALFGRDHSVPFPEHSIFVDFPITLRKLLEFIDGGVLTYRGIQTQEGDLFLVFQPSKDQLPKGLGRYQNEQGKEKLHINEADSSLLYYYRLNDPVIPEVEISEALRQQLNPWDQEKPVNKPSWWNSRWGSFEENLNQQRPLYFQDEAQKVALQKATVMADDSGAIMVGDCDLMALMPSQRFLDALDSYKIQDLKNPAVCIENLKELFLRPLNISEDYEEFIYRLHYLRQAFLLFAINEAAGLLDRLAGRKSENLTDLEKRQKDLLCQYDDLARMTQEDLLMPLMEGEAVHNLFGNVTGILNVMELEFNVRVNKKFLTIVPHIGQFLNHGPENRNPGEPSDLDDKLMHLHEAGTYLTTNLRRYKEYVMTMLLRYRACLFLRYS